MQANFGGREDRTILHQALHQTSFTSTSHQLQHFRNLHLVSAHKEACRVHQTVAHGVEYSKHACYSKYAIWSSELRPQMAQYNWAGHVVAKVWLWHCRVYNKCPCTMGNVCKASKTLWNCHKQCQMWVSELPLRSHANTGHKQSHPCFYQT